MLLIRIINGNLLKAKENIIAHQVNTRGVMGSGVALAIKNKYPIAFDNYKKMCDSNPIDKLLGKVQFVKINNTQYVCNIFAQNKYGWGKQYTDEEAFEACINHIYYWSRQFGFSVAMPYNIGCGRGGAKWDNIYSILETYFGGEKPPHLVLYKL